MGVGALLVLSLASEAGADLEDVSLAVAGIQEQGASAAQDWAIYAFQVDGVGGQDLVEAFLAPYVEFDSDDLKSITVDGRELTQIVSRTAQSGLDVVWSEGDVLYNAFGIRGRARLREILRAIPAV